MKLKVYIVNAFSEKKFSGNPAAVVMLKEWLSETQMQQIAAQNNLAETAYVIPLGNDYEIRWFTPAVEVDLCGHATLASAHVMFEHLGYDRDQIIFHSKGGPLKVTRGQGRITLDFPANEPDPSTDQDGLIERGLGIKPKAVYKSRYDYMVVLNSQSELESQNPDL